MLLDSPELFRTLLDRLHEGVYFVDLERRIQYWNPAAERITGYSRAEAVGKRCAENLLMHVDEQGYPLCTGGCPLADSLRDGRDRQARVYLQHKNGHRVPVRIDVAVIRDGQGQTIGALETFHDDTPMLAMLRENEDLKQSSLVCALTGVGNRRLTEQVLDQRLNEMRRQESRLAAALVGIDHLERVAGAYGRAGSDDVLKMVARTLHNTLRLYDFIGRWNDDEFLLVKPAISPLELEPVADRLRRLVEQSSRGVTHGKLKVTVSIGACLSNPDDSVDTIAGRADRLMREGKTRGGNCTVVETE